MVKEETLTRAFANGEITGTTWLCGDIKLGHSKSTFKELFSYPASNHSDDVVRLHFGLKGDYTFTYKQLQRSYDLVGGHHNLMYSREFDIVVQNKTLELETFGVQFPRQSFIQFTQNGSDALKRFCDAVIEGHDVMFSGNWGSITPAIQTAIHQVINCNYSGETKALFMLSKSVELLMLSADSCSATPDKQDLFLKSKADREKIIAVRDLINEKVHCPPNLSEISRSVGLNEYKLKRGFKETFNTTVFGYLTDQRLHLAQQYLRDSQKTAAEISAELGYATPQHFSNAFKKKFGATPQAARKNP